MPKTILSAETLRFIRFVIVGVVNTAASYGFFVAYIYLGIPYIIAGTLSFITSICFNYFVTVRFVFDKVTKKNTFMYYLVSYGLLYFYSLAMLWFLVDVCKLSAYLAGLVLMPVNAIVSFILLRVFVFRRGKRLYG